eukprot:7384903-Prymnesium_polylepis.1
MPLQAAHECAAPPRSPLPVWIAPAIEMPVEAAAATKKRQLTPAEQGKPFLKQWKTMKGKLCNIEALKTALGGRVIKLKTDAVVVE